MTVSPPLPCVVHEIVSSEGKRLLYFQADWSPSVHLLADSRCLPRVGASNQPFDKDKIKALKDAKHQGLFERTFPAGGCLQDLDDEVWMFNDRMEICSPGLPPSPVTLDALAQRKHMHCSRNPLIVRALTILGFMRELGEGVPRMFEEMEKAGCYPPDFVDLGGVVQVTLRNEPIYDRATLEWLSKFKDVELSGDQKRVLAYAHAHGGRFTSRNYQDLIGTGIYGASTAIKDMVRKGVVKLTHKGGKLYLVQEPLTALPDMPDELVRLLPLLQRKGTLRNEDVRLILNVARNTAARIMKYLVAQSWLVHSGRRGLGAFYAPGERLLHQSVIALKTTETGAIGPESGAMKP